MNNKDFVDSNCLTLVVSEHFCLVVGHFLMIELRRILGEDNEQLLNSLNKKFVQLFLCAYYNINFNLIEFTRRKCEYGIDNFYNVEQKMENILNIRCIMKIYGNENEIYQKCV